MSDLPITRSQFINEVDYYKAIAGRLQAENTRLKALAKAVTGHNIPTAYDDEYDEAGHCPYCSGWNMQHRDGCEIYALEQALKESE